jgi:hypothetical protein
MAFQYLCPQGHLLEGDEAQVGQKRRCPYCGTVLLVPEPIQTPTPGRSLDAEQASPDDDSRAPPDRQPAAGVSPVQPSDAQPSPCQQAAEKPPPVPPPLGEAPGRPNPLDFPQVQVAAAPGPAAGRPDAPGPFRTLAAAEQPIVHVVCPGGHPLETPREILGQQALCPFCGTQFQLRLEDSVEYREEMAREKRQKKARLARLWVRGAIIAAVALVLGVIAIILLSASL